MNLEDHPRTTVTVAIKASPADVWAVVRDVTVPPRFSDELVEAHAEDSTQPLSVGDRFVGSNQSARGYSWQTTPTITASNAPTRFAWRVGDEGDPVADWEFVITPTPDGCTLSHTVTLGPGESPLRRALEARPDKAQQIIDARLDELRVSMTKVANGIASLCEAT